MLEEDDIAHDHRVVSALLERGPRGEALKGLERPAIDNRVDIRARFADFRNVAAHLNGQLRDLPDQLLVGRRCARRGRKE